jgi:hypothetical protein
MTVTAHPADVTTNRAAKAARYARYALDGGPLDTAADWDVASSLVGAKPASETTQAMVAGIVDAAHVANRTLPRGSKATEIAYNTGHRATVAAQAFALAGLGLDEVTAEQWDIVKVTTAGTRAVTAILATLFEG